MSNSTHKVEIVPVVREPHPNADKLSVVRVFGYTCVINNADWPEDVKIAAYVPPDNILPDKPEYAWLGENKRIKARKFRGILSFGLLVPAPEGAAIGDDVATALGITHYNPPEPLSSGGEVGKSPPGHRPCYDVDSFRRYGHVFQEGEIVQVSEKLHGCNSRYTWIDDEMFCGSRTEWKKPNESNIWWRALAATPELEAFCKANPGKTVYGEVYGQVQDLKYGCDKGVVKFAAFDILDESGKWIDAPIALALASQFGLPWVPLLATDVPFNIEEIEKLCDGPSLIPGANHIREGCVIKPIKERWHIECGRVQLKLVSAAYLNL